MGRNSVPAQPLPLYVCTSVKDRERSRTMRFQGSIEMRSNAATVSRS